MSKSRSSDQPELPIKLLRGSGGPLHLQLEQALRDAIRGGRLRQGSALPSTRTLAADLGVARGVVVEAYEQLAAEGFLATRRGAATTVAAGRIETAPLQRAAVAPTWAFDFKPGVPDLRLFPFTRWSRSARRVLRGLTPPALGYGDARGTPELRTGLADYLGRVRQVRCDVSQVLVCSGFAQGLGLVAKALARHGVRRFGIEDPTHPDQQHAISAAGLQAVHIPVDEQGLRVDLLEASRAEAVLVTPAHQFPTGAVLSAARRQQLAAWATARGGWIVEDDYDAEYRYDREPIGALQSLAPSRVIYAGSASKILAPALRLGWIVAPPPLGDTLAELKRLSDMGTPLIEQLAYADFLAGGELDRHLRRMRAVYRARRDAVIDALAQDFPGWLPHGIAAGLHLLAWLPARTKEAALVDAAARRGIRVLPLAGYCTQHRLPPALVLGYAGLNEGEIRRAFARLAKANS
ncbi:PLP-dependent aminotransferase family protein [Aquincola sp. S2]|uniref:PLP-dependent aminotransferase family protein n=1 Tax=Pseudaquabacterium terrae TaxID=2732868 RepID=A0ABX2EBZ8_9BURK|nr:PLP-dependent aminotransferase family protein [Aquabacterium terrae]NRF66307.1 PLP-dependent aminotransferase family protein [Aquabacterium terrae]